MSGPACESILFQRKTTKKVDLHYPFMPPPGTIMYPPEESFLCKNALKVKFQLSIFDTYIYLQLSILLYKENYLQWIFEILLLSIFHQFFCKKKLVNFAPIPIMRILDSPSENFCKDEFCLCISNIWSFCRNSHNFLYLNGPWGRGWILEGPNGVNNFLICNKSNDLSLYILSFL